MNRYTPTPSGHNLINHAHKGRGAVSNEVSRFEAQTREVFDDGWDNLDSPTEGEEFSHLNFTRTTLAIDATKSLISYNKSPDIPFDRSINPYRGCEHGCVYCYARPTHSYWGLSAGLDFETRLFYKPDAVEILERELAHPKYSPSPIAFGTNTDPYQPVEKDKQITRSLLKFLVKTRHPFTIVTKSNLILRDLDILQEAAQHKLVRVLISVTTLDRHLANKLEPRATTPAKRLEAIQTLSENNIPVGSLVAPIIPALNDHEIETILQTLSDHGAETAGYILLRLPLEVRTLMEEWLDQHYPTKKRHVLSLIEQSRDGKLNHSEFGKRMVGTGAYADIIRKRFNLARQKHFTNQNNPDAREELQRSLSIENFIPPTPKGGQFSLL